MMDRGEGQMEGANPGDHFGSHAERLMERHDEMAPAPSEFLRKPYRLNVTPRHVAGEWLKPPEARKWVEAGSASR